jgi:protein arginine N-methyltransferase 1
MFLSRIKSCIRLLYRDFILWVSDVSTIIDEVFTIRLLSGTGAQYYWSRLDVHRTLMLDEVRLNAFRAGIKDVVRQGDVVLDVGTGTGVLSFYAVEAGASKVYAVDSAKVIDVGRKAAERAGIDNIEFIRTDVRDLSIPEVDCIISELIGMEVVDEGIMDKIRMAKKFLKEGGSIIPSKLELVLAPVDTSEIGLGFWKKMYGIDYSVVEKIPKSMRNFEAGSGTRRLASDEIVYTIDLHNPPKRVELSREFTVEEDGVFTGCLMYFNAWLSDKVVLSTAPEKPLTHWKQIFIPHEERAPVKKGDRIRVGLKSVVANSRWKWKYEVLKLM